MCKDFVQREFCWIQITAWYVQVCRIHYQVFVDYVEFFTICFSIAMKYPYALLSRGPEALNSTFSGTTPRSNGYTII